MNLPQVEQYLDTVCARIKNRRIRAEVREEMRCHLEDHALRLMQCGLPEEAAWLRAAEEMGTPEEVAEQLGEIHAREPLVDVKNALSALWWGMFFSFFYWDVWFLAVFVALGPLLIATALWQMHWGNRRMHAAFWVHLISCIITVVGWIRQTGCWIGEWSWLLLLSTVARIVVMGLVSTELDDLLEDRRVRGLRTVAVPYACAVLFSWFCVIYYPDSTVLATLLASPVYLYILVKLYQARRGLCADEENLPDFRPLTKRNRVVGAVAVAVAFLLPLASAYLVKTKPPETVPYVQADVSTDVATAERVDAIKAKLQSMGYPQAILDVLPQSELLAYQNFQNILSLSVYGTESDSLPLTLRSVCTEHADGTARWVIYYEWVAPPPTNSRCQFSLYVPKEQDAASRTILLAGDREIVPFSHSWEFAALAGKERQRGVIVQELRASDEAYTCSARFAYQDSLFRIPFHQKELNEHQANGTVQGGDVWQAEYLTQTIGG